MIFSANAESSITSCIFSDKRSLTMFWKIAVAIETPIVDPVARNVYWIEVVQAWYFIGTAAMRESQVTVKIHEYPNPGGIKMVN